MKQIKTEDAVGHILCHDMTQIIKGVRKDAIFRKGHVVKEEDIPVLLSIGKEHIYIWEQEEGMLHENDAAEILCNICKGENISRGQVKEGKIDLYSEVDGLLKVDVDKLHAVNSYGDMMIATIFANVPVKKGSKLAGTRVIPLLIEEEKMMGAKEVAGEEPLLHVLPFKHKKVGIITTGNEVYTGRIQDTFTPVLIEKLKEFDAEVISHVILGDDNGKITETIHEMIAQGADLILCSGGMSVDPDDKTPLAIKNTGATMVTYGAPVLPGAMFLLAYYDNTIPVVGLPGCVMYSKRTIFDLILPRLMADDKVTKEQIARLGYGGLCMNCEVCTYPNCGFGKGV